MANPIQAAKELHKLLELVRDTVKMAQKPREKVLSALDKTNEIIAALEDIHVNNVPLDIKDGDGNLAQNLECWKSTTPGVLKAGTPAYQSLISNSETLKALYATGIDLPSITKFSDQEIKLAKGLGDRFQEFYAPLRDFAASLNHHPRKAGKISSNVQHAALNDRFFGMLKEFGVVDDYAISLFLIKSNKWVNLDFNRLPYLKGKTNRIRIDYALSNTQYQDLIRGHWFNAYAYYVIDDHLERNQFDYEIYTRVSYTAPADIIRSAGDFDIIAMVGSQVLLVECKSGELKKDAERDDFVKIIEKTKGVKKVFDYTKNDYSYIFLLIYNDFANTPEELSKHLEGTEIKPVKPDQIRGTVIELFSK